MSKKINYYIAVFIDILGQGNKIWKNDIFGPLPILDYVDYQSLIYTFTMHSDTLTDERMKEQDYLMLLFMMPRDYVSLFDCRAEIIEMLNSFLKTSDNINQANQLFDESLIRTGIFQELKGYISLSSAAIDDFTNTFDDTIGIINQVIKLLKSIGRQTTMLAMNAGIEAAKSEEQSAGFEIVAANIQRLSQHTVQSSEDLKSQINQIEDNAKLSVEQITTAMDSLSDQLENTHENLNRVQNELNQISGNVDTVSESYSKIGNSAKIIKEQIDEIEL